MDAHANFAYSTIAVPPSPALSGTSLTVAAGEGALFPTAPFNATVWPANTAPRASNAEIVRVTARVGDVLTFVRAQEGTVASVIVAGSQIAATITAKTLTDIEDAIAAAAAEDPLEQLLREAFGYHSETFTRMLRPATFQMVSGRQYYTAFAIKAGKTINAIDFGCHAAGSVLTLVKFGVVSLDFATLHCVSGDEKAQYTSPGLRTNPMLVPYTSPIDQVLYGTCIALGTTGPNGPVSNGAGRGDNGKKAGAAAGPCFSRGGQTDITAGGTPPIADGNSMQYWMGFS